MDEALPSVHSACTSQCSARCPLTAAAEDDAVAVTLVDTVEVAETSETIEICETVEVYEFAGA